MSEFGEAIKSKGNLVGTLVSIGSTSVAEALSCSGLDWLFFDLEHSVLSLADVQSMTQAMRPHCLSVIRVEEPEPVYVKRALDTGCAALIVPQVNSVETAKRLVAAGKFSPVGSRSVGLGRSLEYGMAIAKGVAQENDRTAIFMQIEHIDAVSGAHAIAALPGVAGLFVGPYDLSSSLGMPGEISHPVVQRAIGDTLDAARRAGKPAGIFVGNAEMARKEFARGFQFVAVGSDVVRLVVATRTMCEEAKVI